MMNYKKLVKENIAARLEDETPHLSAYESIPRADARRPWWAKWLIPFASLAALASVIVLSVYSLGGFRGLNHDAGVTYSSTSAIPTSMSQTSTPETEGSKTTGGTPAPGYYHLAAPLGNSLGESLVYSKVSLENNTLVLNGSLSLKHTLDPKRLSLGFNGDLAREWNDDALVAQEEAALKTEGISDLSTLKFSPDTARSQLGTGALFASSVSDDTALRLVYPITSSLATAISSGKYAHLALALPSLLTGVNETPTVFTGFSLSEIVLL
jgi:hypothetical protein